MTYKMMVLMIIMLLIVVGCSNSDDQENQEGSKGEYQQIAPEEAKALLDESEQVILLDVREQSEYDEGHIPGSILLSLGSIETEALNVLPDYDQTILVYCRSGNRSRQAANTLLNLGYTDVRDLGGIKDWPYEIEQ